MMFPNAISEVISELKSVREPSERISGGPHSQAERLSGTTERGSEEFDMRILNWDQ